MIPSLLAVVDLYWGLVFWFGFSSLFPREIQPYPSDAEFPTSCHRALTLGMVEHLGVVPEAAVLAVHFANVGGAQCTSWRRLVLAGCLQLRKD